MGHVRLCSLEINSLGIPTSTSNGCRSPEACRAPDSQHHQEQCRDGVDLVLTVAIPQYNSGVINPSLLCFFPQRYSVTGGRSAHRRSYTLPFYLPFLNKECNKMLTPKTLTNTLMRMKFQQVLIHFCAKDHYRLCHTVHRLIHSLEFQAHTQCDPTSLYLSMFCLVHVFSGFSTVRK